MCTFSDEQLAVIGILRYQYGWPLADHSVIGLIPKECRTPLAFKDDHHPQLQWKNVLLHKDEFQAQLQLMGLDNMFKL